MRRSISQRNHCGTTPRMNNFGRRKAASADPERISRVLGQSEPLLNSAPQHMLRTLAPKLGNAIQRLQGHAVLRLAKDVTRPTRLASCRWNDAALPPTHKRRATGAKRAADRAHRLFTADLQCRIDQSFSSTLGLLNSAPRAPRFFFESPRKVQDERFCAATCDSRIRVQQRVAHRYLGLHVPAGVCAGSDVETATLTLPSPDVEL